MTLNEQVIQVVDNLNRDSANVDIWVNGDENATYTATGGEEVPSIQRLVKGFESKSRFNIHPRAITEDLTVESGEGMVLKGEITIDATLTLEDGAKAIIL